MHKLLFCVHTPCMSNVTKTFLLVSSSVSSKQLLCFVHGQGQKREQKPRTKNFVEFHNHSPPLTMVQRAMQTQHDCKRMRKKVPDILETSNNFLKSCNNTTTSRYRCDALTNRAMKPLTLGAIVGSYVPVKEMSENDVYEINHHSIITSDYISIQLV